MRNAAPVMQNHLSKPEDLMLQNATLLRKSAPWPPTCLLYCASHAKCIFADPLQMSHACHRFRNCYKTLTICSLLTTCRIPCACHAKRHLNVQKWSECVVFFTLWLRNVLRATFSTSQLPKVLRHSVFYILTSTCASRHNGVHFFIILTSKRAPALMCFAHFYFEICFAPQRRALFKHLNFQKCSDIAFSTFLTSTCASRHNGVHFFIISTSKSAPTLRCFWHFDFQMCFVPQRRAIVISHLPSWLCTRRFWGPTFRLSWAPSDFSTFSPASSFFRLFLFCDLLSSLLFSDFSRLCFFICPYCRKFDFKTSFDKYILYVGWATKWELRITPPGYANTFELRDDPPSTMAFHPWPSPIVYAHMAYPIGTGCLTSWWDKSTLLNIKVGKKNTHRCLAIRTFVHYPFELSWYMYI